MPTSPVQLKNLAWDIIPCPMVAGFMEPLGLVPSSDDVAEMEHQASHARCQRLLPISDRIRDNCQAAAQVVTAVMLRLDINEDTEPGIVEGVAVQNGAVIFSAIVAILGQLVEDGTLQLKDDPGE